MYIYIDIYRNHPYFDGLYQPMYGKIGDGLLFTIAVLTLSIIYKVLIIKHGARIDIKLVDDYRRCYILPLDSGNRNLHHTTIIKCWLIKCICVKIGYRKITGVYENHVPHKNGHNLLYFPLLDQCRGC